MPRDPLEWLRQADYDMDTAYDLIKSDRYFYAVFLCHLAVEKSLKGLYQKRMIKIPPKTHNLILLLNQMEIAPPENFARFFVRLNQASVVTRYPEELNALEKNYTKAVTVEMAEQSKEVIQWIKKQF